MAEDKPGKTIQEEAGLGPEWQSIDAPVIMPGNPTGGAPLSPNQMPSYFQGSLAPNLQHDLTFMGTRYGGPGIPSVPLMPPSIAGAPSSNAAIQSTAQKVINAQKVVPTPTPVVTASPGDGLIHGDAIWETDSAYVQLRDEFVQANSGNAAFGELSWIPSTNTGSNGGLLGSASGLGPLHIGEVQWNNSTSSNSTPTQGIGNITFNFPSSPAVQDLSNISWALLSIPNWKATFIWRFHRGVDEIFNGSSPNINFSKKSVYIGLAFNNASPSSNGWSRPPIFIGARYDTDNTAPAISDATIKLEAVENALPNGAGTAGITRNNTQGTVVDTGITPSEDAYYRLDILCTSVGVVQMSINGATPSTFTLSKMTVHAGDPGSDSIVANHGQAALFLGSVAGVNVNHPFGPGESVQVSGTSTALDGTFINDSSAGSGQSTNNIHYLESTVVAQSSPGGWSLLGFPSLVPIFMFGNDSQAGPVVNCRICIDYFSFVWNPGVGGGTGTPDPTKSRYFG